MHYQSLVDSLSPVRANVLVTIGATKEGVKFSCRGDIGNGAVTIKQRKNMEDDDKSTIIELNDSVSLTFSLKYLTNFCKGVALANKVSLKLSNDVPLLVEFEFGGGFLRYYLAPKIGDDEE